MASVDTTISQPLDGDINAMPVSPIHQTNDQSDIQSEDQSNEQSNEQSTVPNALVDYIVDRIKLPGFDRSIHITPSIHSTIESFLSNSQSIKLLMYIDANNQLVVNSIGQSINQSKLQRLMFFVKLNEEVINQENVKTSIQFGLIDGQLLDSLLRHMQSVYLPSFLQSNNWPESIKKDLSIQVHKFMASLTESANQARGHTVLYLPNLEQIDTSSQSVNQPIKVEKLAADKDLVQRLESTVIHWTRQIKEVVSNVDYAAGGDAAGPLDEIEFWRSRTIDLSSISQQLDRPGVKRIVSILQCANSSYLKPFAHLTLMIQQGSVEAQNNLFFLSKLSGPCTQLAEATPEQIPDLLPSIAAMIRLIWSHSQYYTTEERLTGLLRKVSNQLIVQCSKAIQLKEIFRGDVLGSMVVLQQSIHCSAEWHAVYEQTCRMIEKDSKCSRKWRFDPSSHGIFAQLDAFAQRCHNLTEVCEGQLQFARKNVEMNKKPLGMIDQSESDTQSDQTNSANQSNQPEVPLRASLPAFGGQKGPEIEKSLSEIESTFLASINKLSQVDYDILNVKATNWHHDYNSFKNTLKDLEVMLANVISSSWECVASVNQAIELIENFSQLAVRPAIKQSVEKKVNECCNLFAVEVKRVKAEFDKFKKDPPLLAGQPRYAGAALWGKSLLARVEINYFAIANAAYVTTQAQQDEAKHLYTNLESIIEAYVRQQHQDWVETVQLSNAGQKSTLSQRLQRPLMIRADTKEDQSVAQQQVASILKQSTASMGLRVAKSGHLEVNFDHHLLKLFNEVRYWDKFHGIYPIPYVAFEMYQHQDSLRIVREAVMLVVRDYNTIVDALPYDDRRLFSEHLRRVDRKISPGLAKLTWNEKHIKDWFVRVCREQCGAVYDVVTAFKANHEAILAICQSMADCLLVDIEPNVVYDDNAFEERQRAHAKNAAAQLADAHHHVVQIVQDSYAFFADHGPEIQAEWRRYVKKTDLRVEEALRHTVKRSLQELSRAINGDSKTEAHPLFRVNMILDEQKGKVEFRPSVADLSSLIKHVSRDSITTIQCVPRLIEALTFTPIVNQTQNRAQFQNDEKQQITVNPSTQQATPPIPSFYDAISNDDEILKLLVHIMHGTTNLSVDLSKLISHYDRYAPIWNTDKAAFIRRYANTKRPLSSFDMDITRYRNNQSDIAAEDASHSVGFIKVDCSLVKASLITHCTQWQSKLTHLLHHNASTELHTLHTYFSENTASLTQIPSTLDKLSESLALLHKTQTDLASFQARFGPCEEMYRCLDKFDFAPSDEEKELVDTLKTRGVEYAAVVAQASGALESRSIEMKRELEESMHSWAKHASDLKNEFKEQAPFAAAEDKGTDQANDGEQAAAGNQTKEEDLMPDVQGAFAIIQSYKSKVVDHRAKADAMSKGIHLFNLRALDLSELDDVDRELLDLERVWTVIREWEDRWRHWRSTSFTQLNTEEMDTAAANHLKTLSKMNKSIKSWRIHRTIINLVQRFRSTLPLIADLRSPALRQRHWDQIMEEITHRFDIHTAHFTLDSMYALNLQVHADLINQVASTALRELNVEQQLREMSGVWMNETFNYAEYKNHYLIVAEVDSINDFLEKHQLMLSTMKNSPFYPTFVDEINYFSAFCNELSECVELLMTVQKQWRYLECIFNQTNNASIKRQLPSESQWFQSIHDDFMRILRRLAGPERLEKGPYNGYKIPRQHSRFGSYGGIQSIAQPVNPDEEEESESMFHDADHSTGGIQLRTFDSFRNSTNDQLIGQSNEIDVKGKVISLLASRALPRLTRMTELLDRINHALDAYLESKRQQFPRFYFLSNDDLLSILGQTREPHDVNQHTRKMFPGIQSFDFKPAEHDPSSSQPNNQVEWEVVGVESVDGEYMRLLAAVPVDGEIEAWLNSVDLAVNQTSQKLLYLSLSQVSKVSTKKSALENWVHSSMGHLMLISSQIGWTAKVTQAITDLNKNRKSIKKLKSEWHEYLNKLAKYVRAQASAQQQTINQSQSQINVDAVERAKLTSLITIEVHARDVIDKLKQAFKQKDKLSLHSFEWAQQLRFYFEKSNGEFGQAIIKQSISQSINYGYELVEFSNRLVITPLTDRAYLTLTTALSLARGGSPIGPAGTGKTETVKDLSKNCGAICVVFNCSSMMNVDSLVRNLSGLSQTGAWGCFDEFNRISIEVLSVISLNIAHLYDSLRARSPTVTFDGHQVALNPSVGLFITMNPGYAGRTELPESLERLFRPVAMIAPDSEQIAEILLQSSGFKESSVLARKLFIISGLMEQQLSKQSHYSYGLRALKAVLLRAATIMRTMLSTQSSNPSETNEWTEEMIVMRALRECNRSKLISDDRILFDLMLVDVFPNVELPLIDDQLLRSALEHQCAIDGLVATQAFIDKCVQVYETKLSRHGVALVGSTLTGKSTAWRTLAAALTAIADAKTAPNAAPIEWFAINPKSINTNEMFGRFTADGEWRDGILSSIIRRACAPNSQPNSVQSEKWIVLDGPVDTHWIESLNTLLDDTKVLTLINGDRINLPPNVRLFFEIEDLRVASPATVSRLGMVHFDHATTSVRCVYQAWLKKKSMAIEAAKVASESGEMTLINQPNKDIALLMNKEGLDFLGKLFDKYAMPALNFKNSHTEMVDLLPTNDAHLINNLTKIFDAITANPANGIECTTDETNYMRMLELWFTFAVIWSIGATLGDTGRARFDVFIRDIEAQFPPLQTVYEYVVDASKKDWTLWEDHVNNAWRPSPVTPFHAIIVPTIDTVRQSYLINHLINRRVSTLVVGQTGTGKTSQIQSIMEAIDQNVTLCFTINLSTNSSAELTQSIIEGRLEKRQRFTLGPQGARSRLLVFVDDLNIVQPDEFGAQEVHELLRQFVDYQCWFDRSKQQRLAINDVQLVASMGFPGGSRSTVNARLQSKFFMIHFVVPNEAHIKRIFRTLLVNHFSEFDEPIKPLGLSMTQATLDIYRQATTEFLPTPATPHYAFNLRDLSSVVRGLLQAQSRHLDTRESVLRLWIHECSRVFGDRLATQEERDKLVEMVNQKLQNTFDSSFKKLFKEPKQQPIFSQILDEELTATSIVNKGAANDLDDSDERRPYTEVTQKMAKLKAYINQQIDQQTQGPTVKHRFSDLVLFDSAIEHLTRIHRTLCQPRGSALLIGVGGSGRSSLVRLAASMAKMEVKELNVGPGYRVADFKAEMKDIYMLCGIKQHHCVLLVKDNQIIHEEMFDDINCILQSGEIHRLFPPEELSPLLEELRLDAIRMGKSSSADSLYSMFIDRVRTHLHLAICMSPVGAGLRTRIRQFPALVNSCSIDYFNQWSSQALNEVAARLLQSIDLNTVQTIAQASTTAVSDPAAAKNAATSAAGLLATNAKLKESLAAFFTAVHTASLDQAQQMRLEIKRDNWITATRYLDVVKTFRQLFESKRATILAQADKLRAGLSKLESSGEQVKVMTIQLEEKKKIVAQKKLTCDKLLVEIVQKQRAADEQKKQVEHDAARTEIEATECESIRSEAQEELDKVLPALDKAVRALDKLSKSAVTEVKSYQKPPKPVEKVMCAVMTVLDKEASWAQAKKELNDPNFLYKLKEFDKDKISNNTLKSIQKFTKNHDFNPDDIGNVSQAAGALCEWVIAMEMYAKVFRDVEPRRQALAKAEASLQQKQEELSAAEGQLTEVQGKVAKLEEAFSSSELEQNTLRREAEALEAKLRSAAKLVDGLSSEKLRWDQSIKNYQIDLKNLLGDCALAAAFVSYVGPFTSVYRELLIKKAWIQALRKQSITFTPAFSAQTFLCTEYQQMQWQIQGLPSDHVSLENGALVAGQASHHWPLLIDPQQQGKLWIKRRERDANLQIIDGSMVSAKRQLIIEQALSQGLPLLIEDCDEELDSSLEPILAIDPCELLNQTASRSIVLGKKEIVLNSKFRLYLTTKLSNPHYKPEVFISTNVVNFSVIEKGLENQLLGLVVRLEEPQLEKNKSQLVREMNDNKRQLLEMEDEILSLLQHSSANLIDDEPLINALTTSKSVSESIKQKISSSSATEAKIDAAREQYRACAVRATCCFFVLNELSQIDPMYQFSLLNYQILFESSVTASRGGHDGSSVPTTPGLGMHHHSGDLLDRVNTLNDYHTLATFQYGCRALFDKHKLLFAFRLCAAKLRTEDKIDENELDFFLRGAQVFDRAQRIMNPCSEWLSEVCWDNVCELSKLQSFNGLIQSFESAAAEWKAWYRSEQPPPERLLSPFDWNQNAATSASSMQSMGTGNQNKGEKRELGAFQHLLILRCMRPDRAVFAARQFIASNLGPAFLESESINLNVVVSQMTPMIPCCFILSPGVDPTESIRQVAQARNAHLEILALGQGQSTIAQAMIERAMKSGHWIYLANLHLSLDWLPTLDKIVDSMNRMNPAPSASFRLFLSSRPHPSFPVSLLQNSIKLTTEPARGLRANMMRIFTSLAENQWNSSTKPEKYRRAFFALAWFHSILVERRKFNALGFSQTYMFNEADLQVSENLLRVYIDENEELPWEALRYMIAECNYGGRVTNQRDRRLLNVYAHQFFNEGIFQASHQSSNLSNQSSQPRGYMLSSLDTYYIPDDCSSVESIRSLIANWPGLSEEQPEAFGQHSNADIASQMDETKTLLSSLLSLQPRLVVEGSKTREEIVLELVRALSEQIPLPFDRAIVHAKYDETDRTPLTVVLLQEIDRFNELLTCIHESLAELDRGIRGLAVISRDLEDMFNALYHSRVPDRWRARAYPSSKPLGSWSRDLVLRIQQLKKWHEEEVPKVFWLGGLMRPSSLLTAFLQTTARKQRVAIETLAFEYIVMNNTAETAIASRPKEGGYIKGLYLEGARYDLELMGLNDATPMELFSQLPIIHFKPVEARRKQPKGVYSCPMYSYPVREAINGQESFVADIELRAGARDSATWLKRGTAVMLSLDD